MPIELLSFSSVVEIIFQILFNLKWINYVLVVARDAERVYYVKMISVYQKKLY